MRKSRWRGGEERESCFVTHVVTAHLRPLLHLVVARLCKFVGDRCAASKICDPGVALLVGACGFGDACVRPALEAYLPAPPPPFAH